MNVGLFRVHAFLLYVLTSKGKNDVVVKKVLFVNIDILKLQLYATTNVYVVQCTNGNSSTQDLFIC